MLVTMERMLREHSSLSVAWVRAQGWWDEYLCSNAAGGGHMEVLQWARTHGCQWDEITCSEAALGGQLAVLQWARAEGCDWDYDTYV